MEENLKKFFLNPDSYPHSVATVRHIETHISHVFLTGTFAYKVKKPIQFDFLDFSTLDKRHLFCEREVTLNKRFAAELYIGVVPIRILNGHLTFDGAGEIVEYAVKMKQLDNESLFTELLEQGKLTEALLSDITRSVAKFHKKAEHAPNFWGSKEVTKIVTDNIDALDRHAPTILSQEEVTRLRENMNTELTKQMSLIDRRQKRWVKSLHGDLHLKNIALFHRKPVPFDGIEFNDELSSCDVWADIAFFTMDLKYRGRFDFSILARNIYLEETDDYEGLALLKLYESYRAAVRAKISCLEFDTLESREERLHAKGSAKNHLSLALDILKESPQFIIAIGGLSGSGKSTLSRSLAQKTGAIHIRSDVIRKHLLGLDLYEKAEIVSYEPETNRRVYEGMRERAHKALSAGYSVILDAVHGGISEREAIEALASELHCPFLGVWCSVSLTTARERVRSRLRDASDADEKVVEAQFGKEPTGISWSVINTEKSIHTNVDEVLNLWKGRQIVLAGETFNVSP